MRAEYTGAGKRAGVGGRYTGGGRENVKACCKFSDVGTYRRA